MTARFATLGIAQIGSALCGFLSTLILVRGIGIEGFGFASLGLSVLTYGLVITTFGTDLYAIQLTSRNRRSARYNMTAVMAVRAALSIPTMAAIVILSLSGIWQPGARTAVLLFSLSLFVNILYPIWLAQALERAKIVAMCTFGAQALNLAFVIVAAALESTVVGYAAARVGSDLIVAVALTCWARKTQGAPVESLSRAQLVDFFRHASPTGIAHILRTVALGSDLLLLSFFVSTTIVGLYAAPFRIFTLLISINSIYFVVLLPLFSRRAAEGMDELASAHRSLVGGALLLFVAGLILVAALAKPLLAIGFGPAFVPGALTLQILLVAAAANAINRGYRQVLVASGHRLADMNSIAIASVSGLLVKLMLIGKFNIVGVAAGTVFGEVVLAVLQRRVAQRVLTRTNKSDDHTRQD